MWQRRVGTILSPGDQEAPLSLVVSLAPSTGVPVVTRRILAAIIIS